MNLPEGFVLDQTAPPPGFVLDAPNVAADAAKSAGIGVAKGAIGLAGLPGDARQLTGAGLSWLGEKAGLSKEKIDKFKDTSFDVFKRAPVLNVFTGPGSQKIQEQVEGVTGEFYKPKTTAGQYAQTVGEFAPGMLAGPTGTLGRAAYQVVAPGLLSEFAGQQTRGTAYEPYARVAGALAGPAAAATARRAITPFPTPPMQAQMVNALENEGVTALTAGQRTGAAPVKWAESSLGDIAGRVGPQADAAAEQFTAAALRRAGENANRATPAVIDGMFARIGQQFDDLASRNNLTMDRQFANDIVTVSREYGQIVPPSQRAPIVRDIAVDIGNAGAANGGVLSGEAYQALRSRLDRTARASRNDPQLQEALFGLRNALDDAMERSISTQDQVAWREARRHYRNALVIERSATAAGADTAQGLISPSQLRSATVNQNRRAYARGQGDFAELARAGEAVMKPLPNSGTAPRAFFQTIPAAIGAGLGSMVNGGYGAMLGAMAGIAAPPLAGRALMSRPVQSYLGNQAVPPPAQVNPGLAQLLLRAMAAQQVQQPR